MGFFFLSGNEEAKRENKPWTEQGESGKKKFSLKWIGSRNKGIREGRREK